MSLNIERVLILILNKYEIHCIKRKIFILYILYIFMILDRIIFYQYYDEKKKSIFFSIIKVK